MSANQYKGICFICHKEVPAGKGDFQSRGSLSEKTKKLVPYTGRWLVRCRGKHTGNIPRNKDIYRGIIKLRNDGGFLGEKVKDVQLWR